MPEKSRINDYCYCSYLRTKILMLFGMGVKRGYSRQAKVVRESSAEEDICP